MSGELQGHALQNAYEILITLAMDMTQYLKNISRYSASINISDYETLRNEITSFRYIDEAMTWFLDLFGTINAAINSIQKVVVWTLLTRQFITRKRTIWI